MTFCGIDIMTPSEMFPNFKSDAPNCVDCPEHETRITPDPHDWFCDDDITVLCKAANRAIAKGIRPQFEREYCMVPKWCPKRNPLPKGHSLGEN